MGHLPSDYQTNFTGPLPQFTPHELKVKERNQRAERVKELRDRFGYTINKEQGITTRNEITSYAGSDILCLMFIPSYNGENETDPGFSEIQDTLQTVTVSSARSVMPVRRLGETNPAAYTRGSRTIAGSMIFTAGLRDAFINALSKSFKDGEPRKEPTIFVDQIPKFSMAFQASNELGGVSSALLVNITLTNFGTTFSIDDIYTESTFTYVAEQYFPLTATTINDKSAIRAMVMKAYLRGLPDLDLSTLFSAGASIFSEARDNLFNHNRHLQAIATDHQLRVNAVIQSMDAPGTPYYLRRGYLFEDLPSPIQDQIRATELRNSWQGPSPWNDMA